MEKKLYTFDKFECKNKRKVKIGTVLIVLRKNNDGIERVFYRFKDGEEEIKLPQEITVEMIKKMDEKDKKEFFEGAPVVFSKKNNIIFNLKEIDDIIQKTNNIQLNPNKKREERIKERKYVKFVDDEGCFDIDDNIDEQLKNILKQKETIKSNFISELANKISDNSKISNRSWDDLECQGDQIMGILSSFFGESLGYKSPIEDNGEYFMDTEYKVRHKIEPREDILFQPNSNGSVDTIISTKVLSYYDITKNMIAGEDSHKNYKAGEKDIFSNKMIQYEQFWKKNPNAEIFTPFNMAGAHYQLAKLKKINNDIFIEIINPYNKKSVKKYKVERKNNLYEIDFSKYKEYKNLNKYTMDINQKDSYTCGFHTIALLFDEIMAKNKKKLDDKNINININDKEKIKKDNILLEKVLLKTKEMFSSFYKISKHNSKKQNKMNIIDDKIKKHKKKFKLNNKVDLDLIDVEKPVFANNYHKKKENSLLNNKDNNAKDMKENIIKEKKDDISPTDRNLFSKQKSSSPIEKKRQISNLKREKKGIRELLIEFFNNNDKLKNNNYFDNEKNTIKRDNLKTEKQVIRATKDILTVATKSKKYKGQNMSFLNKILNKLLDIQSEFNGGKKSKKNKRNNIIIEKQ